MPRLVRNVRPPSCAKHHSKDSNRYTALRALVTLRIDVYCCTAPQQKAVFGGHRGSRRRTPGDWIPGAHGEQFRRPPAGAHRPKNVAPRPSAICLTSGRHPVRWPGSSTRSRRRTAEGYSRVRKDHDGRRYEAGTRGMGSIYRTNAVDGPNMQRL